MKYFISLLLLVFSTLVLGMDSDFMFTADDFISVAEFKQRLDVNVKSIVQQYRENLPDHLKKGLPDPEEYNSEDYEDVKTPEGRRRYEEASEAFDRDGPEAPAYKASEATHKAKRQARLERDARLAQQQAIHQQNGHHEGLEEEVEDSASAPSSDEDEISSAIDWDIADKITEEAKQKSDPMDWLSNIDWTSLEISSAVSPSKRHSIKPTIELLRKANWRTLSSFPHDGWIFERKEDLGALTGKCDLCNHKIRYTHILSHPEVDGNICAGGTCARHLLKNRATIEHERQARLSSDPALTALIAAIQSLSVE